MQVVWAPGAKVVAPQDAAPTVPEPLNDDWAIATPVISLAPVFVTVYVYVSVLPATKPDNGELTTDNPRLFTVSGVNVADAVDVAVVMVLAKCPTTVPVTVTGIPASICA